MKNILLTGQYMFEVYKNSNDYEVWVQERITDDYMEKESLDYFDISDYVHHTDTFERAIEIGRECLRCLK